MFRTAMRRGLVSVNPKTNKVIREWPEMTSTEVQKIIGQSHAESAKWGTMPVDERMGKLHKVAAALRENAGDCAQLIHEEMGKPLAEAKAEVEKCAKLVEYYSQHAAGFLASTPMPTLPGFKESYVCYRPLGTILSIMPWNFPFWQVIRMAIPTLAAGNTVLLKHSSNVQGCALKIEDIIQKATNVEHAFRTLVISSKHVDAVLSNPSVHGVALTGSTSAGRIIASRAGALLKKSVVELGGSDPYVILPDCDTSAAVEACVKGRMVNTGQSCIGPKRIIVHTDVYDKFAEALVARMGKTTYGSDWGPLVSADAKKEIAGLAQASVDEGAKVLHGDVVGGSPPSDTQADAYFNPLVLGEVQRNYTCFKEEIFGPVLALVRAKDEQDALSLANDSEFGLGAAVFTSSAKGKKIAEESLDAGMCFVNDFVRSDPSLPFGGTKASGLGRECSYFGIHEFVNIKTVCVK